MKNDQKLFYLFSHIVIMHVQSHIHMLRNEKLSTYEDNKYFSALKIL